MKITPLVLGAVFCAFVMNVAAQGTWTRVSSSTTQPLRGAAYGHGQFIVVGDGGTILTSTDGASWTARSSGTTASLRAIDVREDGTAVAVGDAGTVVYSSNGIDWVPGGAYLDGSVVSDAVNAVTLAGPEGAAVGANNLRAYAFPETPMNYMADHNGGLAWRAIVFGRGLYIAANGNGVAVSDSVRNLTPPMPLASTPFTNVIALALVRDEFVAIASSGQVWTSATGLSWTQTATLTGPPLSLTFAGNLYLSAGVNGSIATSADATTWTPQASGSAVTLRGVAGSDSALVAVGDGGTILRSVVTPTAPAILVAPVGPSEEAGGNVVFHVVASGSLPLAYAWARDGTPLSGATADTLQLTNIDASHAGLYRVTVTNSADTVTSIGAALNVTAAGPRIVDSSFAPDPALLAAPSALLPLANGKVLVAETSLPRVVRRNTDGTLDATFSPVTVSDVRRILLAADGRIFLAGGFTSVNGTSHAGVARLSADGALDASFVAQTAPVSDLAEQPDGKLVLALGTQDLARLLPNGSGDSSFYVAPTTPSHTIADPQFSFVGVDPNGKIYAAGATTGDVFVSCRVVRFNADGSLDVGFPMKTAGAYPRAFRVLPNGDVVLLSFLIDTHGTSSGRFFRRYAPDGSIVATNDFPSTVNSSGTSFFTVGWSTASIAADGRALVAGDFVEIEGYPAPRVARLKSDGHLDLSFNPGATPLNYLTTLATTDDGKIYAAGDFQIYDGVSQPYLARLNAVATEGLHAPSAVEVTPASLIVKAGETVTLHATVTGSGPLTYRWFKDSATSPFAVTTSPQATFTTATARVGNGFPDTGLYYVSVANALGRSSSAPVVVQVLPPDLAITSQPSSLSVPSGRDLTLSVSVNDPAFVSYEWKHDGITVASANDAQLTLSAATAATAGHYTVTATRNVGGTITSAPIIVTVDDTSRFTNLSTRAFAGTGEQTLLLGFVLDGVPGVSRRVLIRGIGPALTAYGISSALPDPRLALYNSGGQRLDSNIDWNDSGLSVARFDAVGAFRLDPGSKDAALSFTTTQPGPYTVHLTSGTTDTGVALVEIYEDDNVARRITNVSTRAFIGTGANVAIPGLVISGLVSKRILARAIGPALASYGVTHPLADPQLKLVDANGVTLATNDNWSANASEKTALSAAFTATGAFPLPDNSADAALIATVPPGSYTVIASGVNDTTGVALLEIYELP